MHARGRSSVCRCGPAAFAALVSALLLAAAPAPAREYPTIIVLGAAQPIQTSEGLYTPIVVIDHESGGWYGDGTLTVALHTSQLDAGMLHPISPWLALGYGARLRVTTEGDGRDLYRDGNRDSAGAFLGDSLAAIARGLLFPEDPWRLGLEVERMEARFRRDPATRPDYDLPGNFAQNEARLSLLRVGLLGEEQAEAGLTLAAGERERWHDWALESDASESRRYTKTLAHLLQPLSWAGGDRSTVEAWWLDGHGLDLFSGYAVGGLGGRYPVGGYFRNEFRTQRAAVLNLGHEWRIAPDRRVSAHADAARLETISSAATGRAGEWETLASLGLGFYYGIRSFGGVPVIVRYAEGLLIPEGSQEGHRREILLVLAAGF